MMKQIWLVYAPPSDMEGRGPDVLHSVWDNEAECKLFVGDVNSKPSWGGSKFRIKEFFLLSNRNDLDSKVEHEKRMAAMEKLRRSGMTDEELAALGYIKNAT